MLMSNKLASARASDASTDGRTRGSLARRTLSPVQSEAPSESDGDASSWNARRHTTLLSMLERIGCGYLVLNDRKVVESNATARIILEREGGGTDRVDGLSRTFHRLLDRARAKIPQGSVCWAATSFAEGFTLVLNHVDEVTSDGTSIVILLDLDAHPEPNPATLQHVFGLTLAETRLALLLARGSTPSDVARIRRLSRTTIRSQLASVFAKTQTKRQAELVALLGRLAVLP